MDTDRARDAFRAQFQDLPAPLRHQALRSSAGRPWLDTLCERVLARCGSWHLVPDPSAPHPFLAGHAGLVVPVIDAAGARLALKCQIPDPVLATEATALHWWSGQGAVTLFAEEDGFLLLERLDPDHDLGSMALPEAVEIWGQLMSRLSLPARELTPTTAGAGMVERTDALAERWNDELPARWAELPPVLPRRLLEAALELCQVRGAVGRRDDRDFLVHSELHYFSALRRPPTGEFVAINPHPVIGDREFGVLPMLENRLADLPSRNSGPALRRRLRHLSEAAGLDEESAVGWAVARAVEDVLTHAEEGLFDEAERSLWVATALSGGDVSSLPDVHRLNPLN
ncbi:MULTISPECIES: aminoglycoside phosphotransferase family protein [unclassified Arthrobacter]|uniref:aminoglycoside phosphotransferase family protein n=1 Tax=unclassified Arthrobacter TaxID=235627 RepID=UPI004034C51D